MLSNARIGAVVPVTDLDRARAFYEDILGLKPLKVNIEQATIIYASGATYLTLYQRATASSGEHTIAGFEIEGDYDAVIDEMIARGITFDTFTIPGVDMPWDDRGVLNEGSLVSAWFKDPDGNVLVVTQGILSRG